MSIHSERKREMGNEGLGEEGSGGRVDESSTVSVWQRRRDLCLKMMFHLRRSGTNRTRCGVVGSKKSKIETEATHTHTRTRRRNRGLWCRLTSHHITSHITSHHTSHLHSIKSTHLSAGIASICPTRPSTAVSTVSSPTTSCPSRRDPGRPHSRSIRRHPWSGVGQREAVTTKTKTKTKPSDSASGHGQRRR